MTRIIPLYRRLADAIRNDLMVRPESSTAWADQYSFHVPLPRFFCSIVNKHLIFRLIATAARDPDSLDESEKELLSIFDHRLALVRQFF